eukprot:SAG31_NODE_8736_length_1397_cov_1.622496_1_plen_222_part_00
MQSATAQRRPELESGAPEVTRISRCRGALRDAARAEEDVAALLQHQLLAQRCRAAGALSRLVPDFSVRTWAIQQEKSHGSEKVTALTELAAVARPAGYVRWSRPAGPSFARSGREGCVQLGASQLSNWPLAALRLPIGTSLGVSAPHPAISHPGTCWERIALPRCSYLLMASAAVPQSAASISACIRPFRGPRAVSGTTRRWVASYRGGRRTYGICHSRYP